MTLIVSVALFTLLKAYCLRMATQMNVFSVTKAGIKIIPESHNCAPEEYKNKHFKIEQNG